MRITEGACLLLPNVLTHTYFLQICTVEVGIHIRFSVNRSRNQDKSEIAEIFAFEAPRLRVSFPQLYHIIH